jgi:arabinofuranosyltransferase
VLAYLPQAWLAKLDRFRILLLVLAILLLTGRVVQMDGPDMLMDDAFISFRYAANLSDGLGLVFNSGERVEGYTNFLWTVLIAGCDWIGMGIVLSSKILAMLSAVGTLIILYLFAGRLWANDDQRLLLLAVPVMLYAAMGSQARYVVSGMETLFFTFWVTLGFYLYLCHESSFLSGVAFALSAMTRPEGLLYFALALGYGIFASLFFNHRGSRSKHLALFVAGFLLLYGGYFLWRYSYYGYLLPNTFYAKASGIHWARIKRGWEILLQVVSWWRVQPIFIVALLAVFPLHRDRPWLLLAAVVLATLAYFVVVGGDFIVWFGPRFIMPVLPMLLLMCAEGLDRISRFCLMPSWAGVAVQFLLLVYLFVNAGWLSWPSWFFNREAFSVQMRGWAKMGHWIAANTASDATLATDAAGLIPFYSGRYAIDMFGLTDLHIAHLDVPITEQSIVAHEKFDPHYILQRRPDYVVSTWMDVHGNAISTGLASVGQQFKEAYELIAVAKIKNGPPPDGRWVVVTSVYTPELHQQGYVTGLFCCKDCPSGAVSSVGLGNF